MESYATAQQVFSASLVFVRLASIVMLIPGIGESYVPARIRLAFAFTMAVMMLPVLAPLAPPLPASAGLLFGVGSSRVDLQACKLEYSIVSPK